MDPQDPIILEIEKLIDRYQHLGVVVFDLALLRDHIMERAQSPSPLEKICHRSMARATSRKCVGSKCDRYKNCRITWKRAELDMKTYDVREEL
jgi:hypothetical protein